MRSRPEKRHAPIFGTSLVTGAVIGAVAATWVTARRRRRIELTGKVALVTGGSRGLGLVLARKLADAGAKVAICARDAAELERARTELVARGAEAIAIAGDVTRPEDITAILDRVRARFGPVDILINNAGTIQVGPLDTMTPEDYEQALHVHFWGPLYTVLGVLPEMRRRQSGRIVNIASIGGKISVPHLLPYSASKFALVGLSAGLRGALARDGIFVTTVCPGLMRTGSPRNAQFKGQHRKEFAWFSIGDSLPIVSMPATRAAQRILDACRRGDAELIMPWSTALAVKLYGLFPEIGADVISLVERVLPGPGGIGTTIRRGAESTSRWSPSLLTALGDKAAARNNEILPKLADMLAEGGSRRRETPP